VKNRFQNSPFKCNLQRYSAGRLNPTDIQRLTEEEAASTSDMFVVLSDVWLDKESTFTRLRAVFEVGLCTLESS
jgi:hypothetical protein